MNIQASIRCRCDLFDANAPRLQFTLFLVLS